MLLAIVGVVAVIGLLAGTSYQVMEGKQSQMDAYSRMNTEQLAQRYNVHGYAMSLGVDRSLPSVDNSYPCRDRDGDGYTDCAGDCDDGSIFINPGMREICGNQYDENCDGTYCRYSVISMPSNTRTNIAGGAFYPGTQHLQANIYPSLPGGVRPIPEPCHDWDNDGYTNCFGDCDDRDPNVHPGAFEGDNYTCQDSKDNDCDGDTDCQDVNCTWYC